MNAHAHGRRAQPEVDAGKPRLFPRRTHHALTNLEWELLNPKPHINKCLVAYWSRKHHSHAHTHATRAQTKTAYQNQHDVIEASWQTGQKEAAEVIGNAHFLHGELNWGKV